MAVYDNLEIYVAYYIGEDLESGEKIYTKPHKIYANVGNPFDIEDMNDIGRVEKYDRTLYVDAGENTQFIREDTRLWVDCIPNESCDNFDYVLTRVSDNIGGYLRLYVNAVAPDTQFMFYSNDGEHIFRIKVYYDKASNTAIVPKNMYLPINKDSLVWYRKPSNIGDTNHLLRYIDKTEYERTYTYNFEDV